ncbi:uncharacterized protein PFL1_01121 [Pseudozyma flocculosa PF-1]|uniref:Nibrin second BRCT domain-containing protein n=1 Tax=Pseudozyma flocculosa TaxID=84751 RepID=A0A5C3FEC3_9BASI|nr:uncharacterized protein PFL1_01121 [Pseudozyma flocculosa PF-1]EPQ31789.1 hypothetical protein PFL1_01121 [Pseudozyma flocculosa PF-1]SPO41821.1 uncharacterized protein PSFLO_07303 [Pseudozyma flocculosa]
MWLLCGRFGEDVRDEHAKLLKYGQNYLIGRKIPADILVDSKFVSRTACRIAVDTLSPHHLTDIDARPQVTLTFEPNKSRPSFVVRTPDDNDPDTTHDIAFPPNQPITLHHGCSFPLTTTISLTLVWKPYAICFSGKHIKATTLEPLAPIAASLGIHLSPPKSKWRKGYTHLCLSQVKPTETVLSALVQAKPIVTLAFLEQLIELGQLPRHHEHSLETVFHEPKPLDRFLPTADAADFLGQPDVEQQLLPSDVRPLMFSGTTVVFFALPADDNELAIYRNILALGGAHVIVHNPLTDSLATKADFVRLLMPYRNRAISYRRNSGTVGTREAPDDGLVVLVNGSHEGEPWHRACAAACANLGVPMPSGFHAVTSAVILADARSTLNIMPSAADVSADDVDSDGHGQDQARDKAGQADGVRGPSVERPQQQKQQQVLPTPSATADGDVTRVEPPPTGAGHVDIADALAAPTPSVPVTAASAAGDAAPPPSSIAAAPTSELAPTPSVQTDDAPATARRPLRRRAQRGNILDELYGEGAGANAEAATSAVNTGEQDRSASIDLVTDAPEPTGSLVAPAAPEAADPTPPVPPTPSRRLGSRLTRRTGTEGAKSRRSEIFDDLLQGAGGSAGAHDDAAARGSASLSPGGIPRSKKYRMELDEEDRRESQSIDDAQRATQEASVAMDEDGFDDEGGVGTLQSAQGGGRTTRRAGGRSRLGTVHENDVAESMEVDGHDSMSRTTSQGARKRPAAGQDVDLVDDAAAAAARKRQRSVSVVEAASREAASGTGAPPTAAHATAANQVIRRSPDAANGRNGVAKGGQPDTEPEFLQALNTQKSRRKKMDEFDDEFNQLKITKPTTSRGRNAAQPAAQRQADKFQVDEDFEAFKKLAEEELRIDVRGNFVQVDFVPLAVRRVRDDGGSGEGSPRPEWQGVPNFKKFKPKSQQQRAPQGGRPPIPRSRQPVAMQLTEAHDYGIGDAYWRKKGSGGTEAQAAAAAAANRITVDGEEMDLIAQPPTGGRVRGTNINLVLSDDSDAEMAPSRAAGRRKVSASTARRRGAAVAADDEEEEDDEIGEAMSDSGPVRANLDLTGLDSDDEGDMSILAPATSRAAARTRRGGATRTTTTAKTRARPATVTAAATAGASSGRSLATMQGTSRESSETIKGGGRAGGVKRRAATTRSDEEAMEEQDEEDSQAPVGGASPRKKRARAKAAAVEDDDDVVVVVDDSSDDGGSGRDGGDGNFAGFGASTSARNRRGAAAAAAAATAAATQRGTQRRGGGRRPGQSAF